MEVQSKPSYKAIVTEQPMPCVPNGLCLTFVDYEDLIFHQQPELLETNRYQPLIHDTKLVKRDAKSKRDFMLDILNDMACITTYVREVYSFQGIADGLKLEDVLNAIECSIKVDMHSETDMEIISCEEDDT